MNFKDITLADVSVETKVETLGIALDSKVSELEQSVSSVTKQIGPMGPKGEQGDRGPAGEDGKPGKDGLNGSDGKDGKDGIDGDDGKDGVSVVDANIAADNSLVLTLSDGSEIDAGVIDTGLGNTSYVNLGRAPTAGGGGGGAVDSVNGQTGVVVLTASDVGAEPANATILKSAAIGVTVQGYNANTVVDASYVHTDNNYTTAEKTKLSGIAAGAEVNVNADWNAISGDAQILNKPALFSGAYADLTGKPTLGTAAAANTTDFATAAQGTLASTALQSYTETDPVYTTSSWYTTTNNSSNWNTAYGWGNHASAGYLLSTTAGTTYVSLTGSYADPAWITSIAGSKVSGNISGNAANITGTYAGTITSSQVTTALGYTPYNSTNPSGYTSNVGTVTNVTANGVLSVATGTTTPAISISQATTSTSGYLSSTDWNTFNGKGNGTVTSVGGTGTVSGLTLTGTVTSTGSLTLGGTLSATASNISDFSTAADARIAAASINALSDVTITSPATNQVLTYNGTGWINQASAGGSFTGGTLTSPLILAAGTATNATEPLKMQSGPVTATPAAGTFEYDGVTIFNTPQAGNRGVIPSVHYITQVSAYTTPTGTANTLKQMFNVSTNGALTVLGNTTYFFDCLFYVTAMSSTSGTLQFGIGGTATFTNILYTAIANKTATAVQTASSHTLGTAKTAVVITAANTTTTGYARIQGKFIVSTGGTIIPSYATSIAAASIVQPGSYFKCWEAGNNTEVEIGAWT